MPALNSFNDLSNIDPDTINIPVQANFKYYTTQEFVDDQ